MKRKFSGKVGGGERRGGERKNKDERVILGDVGSVVFNEKTKVE